MKKYEDEKISFAYPDDFKLISAKEKWGQYDLEKKIEKKKTILIVISIVSVETCCTIKRLIRECLFDEFTVGEHHDSINLCGRDGIGLVVTTYDFDHNFIQKRYQYLFHMSKGGLYVESISEKEFSIDTYIGILESIKVKE